MIYAETPRLILRELLPTDDAGMFELDSDPAVHLYLGNKPVTTLQQTRDIITSVRQQYIDLGIGRWAVIEKATGNFIGWSGLKLVTDTYNNHTNFYDVGYRFIKRYWGKGYATESALAALNYGFSEMKLLRINGMADVDNVASNAVLQKIGLQFVNVFEHKGIPHNWYEAEPPNPLKGEHK
jgi:ribosomal-protein-alanine N-acetyltransferase